MSQYDNNLTGIISKNERKTDDKHPDIKGQCEIDGVQYWVDGWQKTRNSDGGRFYSLRFKRKDAAPQQKPAAKQAPAKAAAGGFDDMDSDIPFRDPLAYRGAHLVL
jgi:hypothetical protein